MESKVYITDNASLHHQNNNHRNSVKFASSADSIPSLIERSFVQAVDDVGPPPLPPPRGGREKSENRGRRHSVLDDLRARRDSLFQRARRGSLFEDREKKPPPGDEVAVVVKGEKRRSSDDNRRGSVFYVSDELPEESNNPSTENDDAAANVAAETEIEVAEPEAKDQKGRRRSWHPLAKPPKLERKRRKGVTNVPPQTGSSPEGVYNVRQKRASWWNIFATETNSRLRRMSQDVTHTRSTENLSTQFRSKSRSVDHGFAAPFDLEALRSKVEGRFESVDKLSKDSDSEGKDETGSQDKKHSRAWQHIETVPYTVSDRDTLTSIAARFDTTPSELTKLNRLGSTFVYPGLQLRVPAKGEGRNRTSVGAVASDSPSPDPNFDHESHDDLPPEEKELLDNLRPVSPKPGHMERIKTPVGHTNVTGDEDEQPFKERFLRINVRHITDGQGVVGGVLLVTPNAVMFDPNVSDPLVIEHSAESYGVIAPMEFIVNAAIYYDIAHMRVGHTDTNSCDKKPEIYYMKKPDDNRGRLSPGKDDNFPELVGDDSESVCSCAERDGDAFPKAFERDLVTPTNLQSDDGTNSTKEKDKDKKTEKEEDSKEEQTIINTTQGSRTLEERRRSMLDHHWAVPSKDRSCSLSVDDEQQDSSVVSSSDKSDQQQSKPHVIPEEEASLVKQSCHDSGIDIRDPNPPLPPIPVVQPIQAKKVYSDADIVLSSDWVPPITIAPTNVTITPTDSLIAINGRKKASSVSFSLDSNAEDADKDDDRRDDDKQESKKNKMLKRLSYPLSWMEGLTGEREEESGKSATDKVSSLPNSAEAPQSSVFSRVLSSPINLVSDFSSGLFAKTPSEESGFGRGGATPPLSASSYSHFQDNGNASSQFSPAGSGGSAGRSSMGTFIRQQPLTSSGSSSIDSSRGSKTSTAPPRLDYRSMVSVEDMPELFVSFDKLIPRPARSCDDPPLYLRLRTGRPKDKRIPRSTPIMSYGKKKLRPEYWFSVPRNRVDDLYRFISAWVPALYGELDENLWRERGYILSDTDTDLAAELSPEYSPLQDRDLADLAEAGKSGLSSDIDDISGRTRESWELIKAPYAKLYSILKTSSASADSEQLAHDSEALSKSEELRRALYATSVGSIDADVIVPDLVGTTEILSDEHREHLCRHLPARAEGYQWKLVFSTSLHGFSLNSMYRKMNKLESPILLVIEDTGGNVFGALTSCSLHVSDHFYGTGESLLFRFTPKFQAFNWTGDNLYFIKGNNESLAIGAGDGKFGLWLDGDLYQGRTQSCSTYGNEPLAPHEDFVVKTLECWAFV
ncbi:nuclear receptor coactivator 7 isoform X3 [Neodiprion virginianus]|uniref:nuclear receptor coactivator 7 isoform X3 n=1 Tax=Neodiprion virginianus TaxID=2961670 RepID=UPI001EE731D3|nr:nuclear receptor coactivator 7 isoform X3 [Neodiprion virginianus]